MVKMAGQAKTGFEFRDAGLAEDCRRVECLWQLYQRPTKGCVEAMPYDDINTAHLLCDHGSEGGKGRAACSWNCKELHKALEVVAISDDVLLDLDLCVDVI
jgi:hypothetical protein